MWDGVDVVAVDVDDDLLQAVQLAYDPGDAHPGGVLEVAGYGQGGHHHRQVSPGGIAGVVEDGAGSRVVLAHTERLLHVPQLVVGGDDLGGVHQAGRDVGDVALEPSQAPGPGQGCLIVDLVSFVGGDKTCGLGALVAGNDCPGPVLLGRPVCGCPG